MITKFATVYAGHVDLPDMGQDATPANERRFSNEHLATVFDKTDAIALTMDELGYHAIWLAEHHFQHEGYASCPASRPPSWRPRRSAAAGVRPACRRSSTT